jgi:hypothetical protein
MKMQQSFRISAVICKLHQGHTCTFHGFGHTFRSQLFTRNTDRSHAFGIIVAVLVVKNTKIAYTGSREYYKSS